MQSAFFKSARFSWLSGDGSITMRKRSSDSEVRGATVLPSSVKETAALQLLRTCNVTLYVPATSTRPLIGINPNVGRTT